ncbi:MAG: hypothetical protein HRT57_15095, partial [Crocinitomicaceae bacterium]|nr:hypothetical protein [Crocinitomicaceae bacterium]
MRDKKFSDIVSERFDGFGDNPSDAVWENIESNLDGDKKRRRAIIWWTVAAGVALSALAYNFTSWNGVGTDTVPSFSLNESQAKKLFEKQIEEQNKTKLESTEALNAQQALNEVPSEKIKLTQTQLSKSKIEEIKKALREAGYDFPYSNPHSYPYIDSHGNRRVYYREPRKGINRTIAEVEQPDKSETESDTITPLVYELLDRIPFPTAENDILSGIQIIPAPKWRIGARVTGFLNASTPVTISNQSNPPITIAGTEFSDFHNSHRRYFEAEIFTQRRMRNRFYMSSGLMFSTGND